MPADEMERCKICIGKGFCSHCSQLLLKSRTALLRWLEVESPVSDRFLKRSGHCINIFVGAEIATVPPVGNW